MRNLIDLGILSRESPVADGIKTRANIQRGLYQVTDNFFRFWYAFVFPNLSELEAGDAAGVWQYVVQPELARYTSRIFEDVCRQYLRQQNRNNALPFRFTAIGSWWNKTDEIDIMATDHAKKNFLLGECKYTSGAVDLHDLTQLQAKFIPKDKNAQLYYWLFSKSGFSDGLIQAAAGRADVRLVTAEQLIH